MEFHWFILVLSGVALFPALEASIDDCTDLGGLLVPVYTPVDDDYAVAFEVVGPYAQYLYGYGVDGVIVAATEGEGPSLNITDNKKLLDAWMEAAKPLGMLVISSVGATPMPFTLEMTRYSEEIGVDAIMALPDVFFRPENADELIYYMQLLSEAAPETPLIYDDIPEVTEVEVDMEEFYDLAIEKVSTFRGVKSNEFENLLALRDKVEPPQKLYAANHIYLAAEVFMGFKDFVMSDMNLFPQLFIDIITYGQNGYAEESISLYQRLVDLLEAITDDFKINELAALKEAMAMITGVDVGPTLPPILPLTDDEKAIIKQALIDYNVTIVSDD